MFFFEDTPADSSNFTKLSYDYDFIRNSFWIKHFLEFVHLFSNFISAICFILLLKFYCSKKYHKVHEKNLNSLCLNLCIVSMLKMATFSLNYNFLNILLEYTSLISSFLLFTNALDLYLTLKSIIKDVFVEENLNRKRFLIYSISGWILPIVVLRAFSYLHYDNICILKLHTALNFVNVILICSGLRSYYYSVHSEATEGYKYYSNEKYTSFIVRLLSSVRFVFYVTFLITRKPDVLTIFDFLRAYEGMFIYYYLVIVRRSNWSQSYAEDQIPFA